MVGVISASSQSIDAQNSAQSVDSADFTNQSFWDVQPGDGFSDTDSTPVVLLSPNQHVDSFLGSEAKCVLINCQVVEDLRTSVGFFTEKAHMLLRNH